MGGCASGLLVGARPSRRRSRGPLRPRAARRLGRVLPAGRSRIPARPFHPPRRRRCARGLRRPPALGGEPRRRRADPRAGARARPGRSAPSRAGRPARLLVGRRDRGAPPRRRCRAGGALRAGRARLFLGEARATARLDRYPSPYQDLATVGAQVLQRIRRFDLYGGAEMVARLGQPSVVDAHYPVGLAFHPSTGVTFGGEIEPGAPARAIADVALKVWAQAPLTHRFDASLAYQFWHFSAGPELVHIFNPALGVALPDDLRLELRAWLSAATLLTQPTQATQPSGASSTGVTGAAGFQLSWRASARLDLGFACTYGAELDQNPALLQLLAYRALVVNAYADRLFSRSWGLRPTLGIDRREAPGGTALWVPSVEVSAYTRW